MNISALFSKYKVFLTGILGAFIIGIAALKGQEGVNLVGIVTAGLVGVSSFVANNYRGQLGSIAGIGIVVLLQLVNNQPVHLTDQIVNIAESLAILYFGYSAPPVKNISYEKSEPEK